MPVRKWTKFSLTVLVISYLFQIFKEKHSILGSLFYVFYHLDGDGGTKLLLLQSFVIRGWRYN